jgi:hypothetical protein
MAAFSFLEIFRLEPDGGRDLRLYIAHQHYVRIGVSSYHREPASIGGPDIADNS